MKRILIAILVLVFLSGCVQVSNKPVNENIVDKNKVPENNFYNVQNPSNEIDKNTDVIIPETGNKTMPENPEMPEETTTNNEKFGRLEKNETWSGEIFITDSLEVLEGVTLTILPGTIVKFKHNRDYKKQGKTSLFVEGTLKAIGSPEKQIFFTSDANEPQNGDWGMIRLFGKTGSQISYVVIEFGQQGVNLWKSDAKINHSIIRWNNWEGLYAESYSTPLIEFNMVYQNGYNGIALEQFNDAVIRNNLFEKSGTHGIHVDATKALVENNILRENHASGLSLDNTAEVTANSNYLENNWLFGLQCGEGENKLLGSENKFVAVNEKTNCPEKFLPEGFEGKGIEKIDFGFSDAKKFDLNYTPGDQKKDKYLYVYPDDETRSVVKKFGKGLGLTWSIALEGKNVWVSGVSGDIHKIDQDSGKILKEFQAPSAQPWGMAFDGKNLWITDFAEKRTYSLDPETGKELFSFKNPDQERGAKGLAWNGKNLLIMGWTTNIVYEMTTEGKLLREITLQEGGGGIAWDGKNFWVPCGNMICKLSRDGKVVGKIYAASEGTWDLEWEPGNNNFNGYLWATQRTNENWQDEKIFKLEILNDQIAN